MAAQITEREVNGERVLELGAMTLIASKSAVGTWHQVTTASCDCKGFQYRQTCRHLNVAAQIAAEVLDVDGNRYSPDELAARRAAGRHALSLMSLDDD